MFLICCYGGGKFSAVHFDTKRYLIENKKAGLKIYNSDCLRTVNFGFGFGVDGFAKFLFIHLGIKIMKTRILNLMQKSATIGLTSAALIVGGVVGVAAADKGGYDKSAHSEYRAEKMVKKISRRLSLNDVQKSKLELLLKESMVTHQKSKNEMHQQVRDIVTQDVLSHEDALKLLNLRKQSRETKMNNMADMLSSFHAILTPEQRVEIAEHAPRMLQRLQRNGKKSMHGGKHGKHGKRHGKHDRDHDDDDDDDSNH